MYFKVATVTHMHTMWSDPTLGIKCNCSDRIIGYGFTIKIQDFYFFGLELFFSTHTWELEDAVNLKAVLVAHFQIVW